MSDPPGSAEVFSVVSIAMTTAEFQRLAELERTIGQCFTTAFEALAEIRDKRLYREKFPTFEEYARSRWGVTASRLRQLSRATEVL